MSPAPMEQRASPWVAKPQGNAVDDGEELEPNTVERRPAKLPGASRHWGAKPQENEIHDSEELKPNEVDGGSARASRALLPDFEAPRKPRHLECRGSTKTVPRHPNPRRSLASPSWRRAKGFRCSGAQSLKVIKSTTTKSSNLTGSSEGWQDCRGPRGIAGKKPQRPEADDNDET